MNAIKKIGWTISLLFVSVLTQAQQYAFKKVTGQIVHDSVDVSGIHVVNISSGSVTISNERGVFEVGAQLGDTLFFSAVQINKKWLVLDSIAMAKPMLVVAVEAFVNKLDEVVVKPHDLSGSLSKDVSQAPPPSINFDDVGIPGFKGKRKEIIAPMVQSVGLFTSVDVEAVYKHLSGYYNRLRKKRANDKQAEIVDDLILFYGVSFFEKKWRIDSETLYEFVVGWVENTNVALHFKNADHGLVIESLERYLRKFNNPSVEEL